MVIDPRSTVQIYKKASMGKSDRLLELVGDPVIRYRKPPPKPMDRRVYVLSPRLLRQIHQYGHERGHPSEVAAVRELLETALDQHDARKWKARA